MLIDKLKIEKLRGVILQAQNSPDKGMSDLDRVQAMTHFQEFSDINSEDEVQEAPVDYGKRRASKMNMKKPPMKMEISSIDSIDTAERIATQGQDPSGGSFQ